MATPAGFEPATCPLGGGCSIQLSHGAVSLVYRLKEPIAMLSSKISYHSDSDLVFVNAKKRRLSYNRIDPTVALATNRPDSE